MGKNDAVIKEVDNIMEKYDPKSAMLTLRNNHGIEFPHQLMGPRYQEWLDRFNEEEKGMVTRDMKALMSGTYVVLPRICPGVDDCPVSAFCPFGNNTPNGLQCPLEQGIIQQKMNDLMEEFRADGHNTTDHSLLARLTELELQDWRINAYQATRAEYALPLIQVEVGADMQGNRLTQMQGNPLFDIKEKIGREKMRITQLLVANPEARYKRQAALKEVANNDVSNQMARMSQMLADIEERMKKKPKEIVIEESK